MERKAGRMGGFWAPKRERQTSLKKRKKQGKKSPHHFQLGQNLSGSKKLERPIRLLSLWSYLRREQGRGGQTSGLRYLGQQAQNTGEKAQWREVRSKGGRESLIFFFPLAKQTSERKGVGSKQRKRSPLSWLSRSELIPGICSQHLSW